MLDVVDADFDAEDPEDPEDSEGAELSVLELLPDPFVSGEEPSAPLEGFLAPDEAEESARLSVR